MRDINLSQENLAVQWQYVKRNLRELGVIANFDDFEQRTQRKLNQIIQDDIDKEFIEQIGAGKYEHAATRQDKRKGSYERYLTSTFGTTKLIIPRTRGKITIRFSLFDKYQRRRKKFDNAVILSMLLGLSTRKQKRVFKAMIGSTISSGKASQLMKTLETELTEYRMQPIEDKYRYLLVDGLWVHVMTDRLREMVILFVMGITIDNQKEMIAFKLASGETEQEVESLLNNLFRRGLEGKHLKVIASDGAKGIRAAIGTVYPYARWQLCHTHKLRNLSSNIRYKKRHQRKMMAEARTIYKSGSKRQAIKRFNRFCHRWQNLEHDAIRCFQKDFYDTIVYYDFFNDKDFISTTNHLERDLEEVRRRIKVQGYFKNPRSADLWTYGIISQFRIEDREDEPKFMFTLIKEPKYESAQYS
jgi:transposase-like protein